MRLSRLDLYLIKDASNQFRDAVQEFRHEANLKDELEKARGNVKENVMQKIEFYDQEKIGIIMRSLSMELEKLGKDYLLERDNRGKESEMLLEKLKDFLCTSFTTSANEHLRQNSIPDLESLRGFLQSERTDAVQSFLNYWKTEDAELREKYKSNLEEKLDLVCKETELKHAQILNERKQQDELRMDLFQKLEDIFCGEYSTLTAAVLSRDPCIDPVSLLNVLDDLKTSVLQQFENNWTPGNEDFQQQRLVVLRERLDALKKTRLDERKQFLDEENQRFAQMKEAIQQKCEKLQRFISNLKLDYIPNCVLLEQIEEIKKYTEEHENFCHREYRQVHKELLKKVAAARNGLFLVEKEILPRNAVGWVEDVNLQIMNSFGLSSSSDDPRDIEIKPAELAEASGPNGHVIENEDLDLPVIDANQIVTRGGKRRVQDRAVASSSKRARRDLATTSASAAKGTPKTYPISTPVTRSRARAANSTAIPEEKDQRGQTGTPETQGQKKAAGKRKQKRSPPKSIASSHTGSSQMNPSNEDRESTENGPQDLDINIQTLAAPGAIDNPEASASTSTPSKALPDSGENEENSDSREESRVSETGHIKSEVDANSSSGSSFNEATESDNKYTLLFRLTETNILMSACTGNNFDNTCLEERSTELVVAFGENGKLVFGNNALSCGEHHWWLREFLQRELDFKDLSWENATITFRVDENIFTDLHSEFLFESLLKSLKREARSVLQTRCSSVRITIPAWFCEAREAVVVKAAEKAGFRYISIQSDA